MRRLAWIWLLCVAGVAWAAEEPQTITPSTLETYVFRNGIDGYDGIRFAGVSDDSVLTTYGDQLSVNGGPQPADTTITLGYTTTGRYRALIKMDVSSLPDSFLVTRAILYVWNNDFGSAFVQQSDIPVSVYRMYRSWPDDVLWDDPMDLNDSLGTVTNIYGSGVGVSVRARVCLRSGLIPSGEGAAAIFGGPIYVTVDSIGMGTQTALSRGGYPLQELGMIRPANANAGYIPIVVTDYVEAWHTGRWANNGLILLAHTAPDVNVVLGNYGKPPVLVVWGNLVTTGTQGGGGGLVVGFE